MTQDRPFLGILLMLGFCVLAPLGDSIAKMLGGMVPLLVLLLVRFAIQAIVLVPIALKSGGLRKGYQDHAKLLWLRSLLHIAGIAMMFTALRYMPLADTLAIAFVMPFIMLILGHFVLNETVGAQRVAACAVGFAGTLLVIQPNFIEVGAAALLPLGVAVVFALFMLVTRQIAKTIDPIVLQTINGFQAVAILAPVTLLATDINAVGLSPQTIWLLLALGLLGTLAHLTMTWSLRYAPSATLAPMQYIEIPIGTAFGFLFFQDLPNGLAAIGICITVAAGLYIIAREGQLSKREAAT